MLMMRIENRKQSKRLWKTANKAKQKDMQKNVKGQIGASDMRKNFVESADFFACHGIVERAIDRCSRFLLTFSTAKIYTGFAKRKSIYFRKRHRENGIRELSQKQRKHLADLQKSITKLGKCRKTSAKIANNNQKATIILIFNKSERIAD